MSNYKKYAEREFKILGWDKTDCEMQQLMCKQILELLEVFGNHGHSGSSAPYALALFDKLARFDPISPLTGKDEEWIECSDGVFQNIRNSAIFKDGKNGEAYWVNGKVFREKNGSCYTNRDSRVPVIFPWEMPEVQYVDVD